MSLPSEVAALIEARAPITLAELQEGARLATRIDRKYVVDWATFAELLRALPDHRTLEIDDRRAFRYESVYFDTPDLGAFRDHMQRRRRRYKVRTRHYVDSGLTLFEVKLKGSRGQTIKHQMPYGDGDLDHVTVKAREFLAERLAEAYPQMAVPELAPVLRNDYRRLTLSAGAERLTCDFDLSYRDDEHEVPGLDPGHVILESKCERGLGAADRELRRLGVKPVACSKYCVGVGLLRDDVKVNEMRWLLSRYFAWTPRPTPTVIPNARTAHA